jgi:hypothetical protein
MIIPDWYILQAAGAIPMIGERESIMTAIFNRVHKAISDYLYPVRMPSGTLVDVSMFSGKESEFTSLPNLDTFDAIESAAQSRSMKLTDGMLAYLESGMNDWENEDEKSYEFDYLHNLDPSYARGEWSTPRVVTYCDKVFQIIETPYLEDSTYFCSVAECDGLQYYVEWDVTIHPKYLDRDSSLYRKACDWERPSRIVSAEKPVDEDDDESLVLQAEYHEASRVIPVVQSV